MSRSPTIIEHREEVETAAEFKDEPDGPLVVDLPPIHPGEHIQDEMDELGLTAEAFAAALAVPAAVIVDLVARRRGITADLALRLWRYFGVSADFWMRLQLRYDLKIAERDHGEAIARAVRPRAG